MSTTTRTSLDMRGKTITTFIAYETFRQLADLADGESLELVTDASEEIDNDLRAWCRTREQELTAAGRT
jgi:TusA-related sulfurtransferase